MGQVVNEQYEFGADFQRKIIALGVRTDFISQYPGAFKPEFFGKGGALQSPRFTIASLLYAFVEEHVGTRPGTPTMEELLRIKGERFQPNQKKALADEWKSIRSIEIPDPDFVREKAVHWAKHIAVLNVLAESGKSIQNSLDSGGAASYDVEGLVKSITNAAIIGAEAPRGGFLLRSNLDYWKEDDAAFRIPTGFPRLDKSVNNGILPGEFWLVIAPPKGAKTTFLINVAMKAIRSGKGVIFFSYEMREKAMRKRFDRAISRMTAREIPNNLSKLRRVRKGMKAAMVGELWLEEVSPMEMPPWKAQDRIDSIRGQGVDVDMVIFDYVNLMIGVSKEETKRDKLAGLARSMSDLAKKQGVVVWSAMLTKRGAEKKAKIEKEDITESYETLAVVDGAVGVGMNQEMEDNHLRMFHLMVSRESEGSVNLGLYHIDGAKMIFTETDLGVDEFEGDGSVKKGKTVEEQLEED